MKHGHYHRENVKPLKDFIYESDKISCIIRKQCGHCCGDGEVTSISQATIFGGLDFVDGSGNEKRHKD